MVTNLLIPHGFEANYTLGFARGLNANGVQFLIISDDETAPLLNAAGFAHLNLRGSLDPTRSNCRKIRNLLGYYLALLWTSFKFRGSTIHFIGLLNKRMILFDGLFLPLWFRFWAMRYVHTAHNVLPHEEEDNVVFRLAYRWIYRFPHVIIAHTAKVAEQLRSEFAVQPARISVISIGLNEEVPESTFSVEDARRHLNLSPKSPIALFFGKIAPYKGVDILLEAWNQLVGSSAQLVIVGDCPDAAYARTIHDAVSKSPRGSSIDWREGFIPNGEVALWFKACDVVVMPYRHIYQSGVVFLCKRFGMPIIATNVGSLAEFVDHDVGIITSSNDPAGIAQALNRFFANQGRFDRRSIAQTAAQYTWSRQCAAIKHLYN